MTFWGSHVAASDAPSQGRKRVVLLAREGKARDKLRLTLAQIGVDLVLEADPSEVDAVALQAVHPQALLIALEPAIEEALGKLDAVIDGGGYTVIFDDAEVAAQRDGWDVQRWSRHLSAKLHGHGDVLPPGREADDADSVTAPLPAMPAAPRLDVPVFDVPDFGLPPSFDAPAVPQIAAASPDFDVSAAGDISHADQRASKPAEAFDFGVLAFDDDAAAGIGAASTSVQPTTDFAVFDFAELDVSAAGSDTHPDLVAASASPLEVQFPPASTAHSASSGIDFSDLSLDASDVPLAASQPSQAPAKTFDLSGLSLEAIEEPLGDNSNAGALFEDESLQGGPPPSSVPSVPAEANPFGRASFEVSDEAPLPASSTATAAVASTPPVVGAPGAVLLFAGMGGPDAVRRVLAELPRNFPRPVLIHQHLDGGSYVNLVRQLERVARMPVVLAEAGQVSSAGTVYVVPTEVAVEFRFGGVGFGAGSTDFGALLSVLPPSDSAVLLLSGADKALVEPVYALAVNGAYVGGQSAQNCYDPAAAKALAERGCDSATPNELAAKLGVLW